MQVIMSHVNTDFDALASMIAAKKIYPEATIVLSDKQERRVRNFLTIYREMIPFVQDAAIDWSEVTELILVDVASLRRLGNFTDKLSMENLNIIVYDHHPPKEGDVKADKAVIEKVGATVTLLVEKIKRKDIPINSFEATIFGLGIYTDTGSFTYEQTTVRDLQAASFLLEQGMQLEMVQQFSEQTLLPEQQLLLNDLFVAAQSHKINGLEITVSGGYREKFQEGLADITKRLLDIKGVDATITVVGMKRHVFIVGRANSARVSLLPLLKQFGGGGHPHAGSAIVKRSEYKDILEQVTNHLEKMLKPAITAETIMAAPVKTISEDTTIEEAGNLMYRYGHSGYPVIRDEKLVGIITRRDLDKANFHGLGHAPVKAYMSTEVATIEKDTTLEEIQDKVTERNIGRLPVTDGGKLVGIVTRTNIIEAIHSDALLEEEESNETVEDEIKKQLENQLPTTIYSVLREISHLAESRNEQVYLIGGIVRDIFLKQPNDDVDIVVEGNGTEFSQQLVEMYGGKVTIHEEFNTATWIHPDGLEIDIATARLEFYDRPGSLPDVEISTLQEDLSRRDFTINAMAICLNKTRFGELVDPFSGRKDLERKEVRILHNLSFVEDPTRILRAVRFETRFDFRMDDQSEQLARQSIDKMKDISFSRIVDELKRIFSESRKEMAIKRLFSLGFWQQFELEERIGEVSYYHAKKLTELYRANAELLTPNESSNWFFYVAIPFYQANNVEKLASLALTKQSKKQVHAIKSLLDINIPEEKKVGTMHKKLRHLSTETLLFLQADPATSKNLSILPYVHARKEMPTYITGDDLKKLGLQPGPLYAEILFALEIAILNGDVTSKTSANQWVRHYVSNEKSK